MDRKLLVFGVIFLAFLVFFAVSTIITPIPVLADANDTVLIDVNVTEKAVITVIPATLNWTGVETGEVGGYKNLTVKNIGSLNVSQIFGYLDTLETEQSNPYGSGDPLDYSAGGVIAIRNESNTQYFFAGRIEWNWTQDIPNHNWAAVTSPAAWGYHRNTSNEYVWVLGNGTAGFCNNSATDFAIEEDQDDGSQSARTPVTTYIGAPDNADANWTYFSISGGSNHDGYCVATYYDCTKIYFYRYDKRTAPYNFSQCTGASEYLYEGNLTSGSTTLLRVDAWVPAGYPGGYLNTTTLTIYASSS